MREVMPCPECDGTRLNRAARNVFVDDLNIADVTSMSVAAAKSFFESLSLPGWRGEIATIVVDSEWQDRLKKVRRALGVPT